MGIWKIAGKEWNRQDGKSSKEKTKKKKWKKRKEKETVKRAWEKKDEEEENGIPPTNIMIMVQNFLLFL